MNTGERVTIIDVRTPEEFSGGHVEGSINIPLMEIPDKMEEFKGIKGKVILCCASGNRSGMAQQLLLRNGFIEVYNGGSWLDVQYEFSNK
jgi:rhodanese-related sulfurtransferase